MLNISNGSTVSWPLDPLRLRRILLCSLVAVTIDDSEEQAGMTAATQGKVESNFEAHWHTKESTKDKGGSLQVLRST